MNLPIYNSFFLFLLSVIFISFSGVMSPGPLTTLSVVKGYKDKKAGIFISLGHATVEVPLIFALYFGIKKIFFSSTFQNIITLVGGIILIYMGYNIIKSEPNHPSEINEPFYNSFLAGALATTSNPYFFIWWATVGTSLILSATNFGIFGILLFSIVHLLCDFFWYTFLTNFVFKTKKFFSKNFNKILMSICGFTLIIFGVLFILKNFL